MRTHSPSTQFQYKLVTSAPWRDHLATVTMAIHARRRQWFKQFSLLIAKNVSRTEMCDSRIVPHALAPSSLQNGLMKLY